MSFVKCADCDNDFYRWVNSPQTRCSNCIQKDDDGEFDSDDSVRCPKCREVINVSEVELYELYEENDDHGVTCHECEYEFCVSTSVSYTFTSPEMESKS